MPFLRSSKLPTPIFVWNWLTVVFTGSHHTDVSSATRVLRCRDFPPKKPRKSGSASDHTAFHLKEKTDIFSSCIPGETPPITLLPSQKNTRNTKYYNLNGASPAKTRTKTVPNHIDIILQRLRSRNKIWLTWFIPQRKNRLENKESSLSPVFPKNAW